MFSEQVSKTTVQKLFVRFVVTALPIFVVWRDIARSSTFSHSNGCFYTVQVTTNTSLDIYICRTRPDCGVLASLGYLSFNVTTSLVKR